jgi:hypothetical protein
MMTNVMEPCTESRAIEEAKACLNSIKGFSDQWDTDGDTEELLEEMREYPAGYAVRSGWTELGESLEVSEYCLTLSGGGPACRIIGNIDLSGDASSARIQYQDWGTPWTDLNVCGADEEILLWFAQQVGPFA